MPGTTSYASATRYPPNSATTAATVAPERNPHSMGILSIVT
jgi:hypothetical protein